MRTIFATSLRGNN